MKILEFGDTSKRKIILIHGFQCPWQVWNKYIEYYKNKFHIIVPIMSGHNPDVKDDFISFAADAIEIEDYILSRYGKEIYAVYRMSMGGVLTATLWQNNRLTFDKVIFDGSPLVSYNKLMKGFMKKFYVDITHKSQQRDRKTVEHGTAVNEILAKKSAKYVKKHHPNTTVKCFKGKFHCENALFNPEIMIVELDKIFDK